jgi:hypothetical protein
VDERYELIEIRGRLSMSRRDLAEATYSCVEREVADFEEGRPCLIDDRIVEQARWLDARKKKRDEERRERREREGVPEPDEGDERGDDPEPGWPRVRERPS